MTKHDAIKCGAAVVASLVLLAACKDNTRTAPTVQAPPGVTGPQTRQAPAPIEETPDIADLEKETDPGAPVDATGPDGGSWQKYPTGLMFEELKIGRGRVPEVGQTVWITCVGTIPETSREIDRVNKDHPLSFRFGTTKVMKGWTQALAMMRPGGRRKVFIPPDLAYGAKGNPEKKIGPNQPLLYEIELISITGEGVKLPDEGATTRMLDRIMGPITQPGK